MNQLTPWFNAHVVHIDTVLGSILILILAVLAIVYVNTALYRLLLSVRSRFHLSYETLLFIMRSVSIAMWLGVGLLLLGFWGVSVSGLWTVLMSIGAVIGVGFLAVWTMVSNITANLFITIWRPFRIGATVEILPENFRGRVIDRNMMFTILREKEGSTLCVPNNLFFQKIFRVTENNQQHLFEFFEHEDATPPKNQAVA